MRKGKFETKQKSRATCWTLYIVDLQKYCTGTHILRAVKLRVCSLDNTDITSTHCPYKDDVYNEAPFYLTHHLSCYKVELSFIPLLF